MSSQVLDSGLVLEERYPLSCLQQGMLYHHLASPDCGIDIEQLVLALHERIEEHLLERAWEIVTARHAVLRTAFRWEHGDEPEQVVCSGQPAPWEVHDCLNVAEAGRRAHCASFLDEDRRRGIRMDRAPLWRLALLRWQPDEFTLIWTFHHAVLDGRSMVTVLREVFAVYDAARRNTTAVLPPAGSYAAYAHSLARQDFSQSEDFWRSLLQGVTAPTPLPQNVRGGSQAGGRKGDLAQELSRELTERLRSFTQANGFTLNTLMQGAWALLLSRHSGEAEVVFGATRACRRANVPGMESMVGLFINTLPVRASVRPEASVIDWLQELRRQWVEMRRHEHSPLVKVQGCSQIPRDLPLFESLVVFETASLSEALQTPDGAWLHREASLHEQTNFALTLSVHDGAQLHLQIGYRTDRFSTADAARLMGHLQTLLESSIDPECTTLGDLRMLSAAERRQVLVEWNDTRRDYPGRCCIHELVERQVRRTPQRIALTSGAASLTYEELNAKANQLAQRLCGMQIGRGSFVALLFDAGIELIIAELAVMKAGAAFVPLDRRWPASRLRSVLEDMASPLILVDRAAQPDAMNLPVRSLLICRHELPGVDENPQCGAQLMDPLYLLFTSGSTGKPKGAVNHHAGIVNRFFNMDDRFGCGERDVVMATTAPFFDSSVWQYFWPLTGGARVVIPDPLLSSDPQHLLDLIAAQRVTLTDFVPALLGAITDQMDEDAGRRARWQSLRHVLVGGEAIIPEVVYRFKAHLPATGVTNAYGPTETSIGVIFYELPKEPVETIPIGRPLHNVQALILDQSLNPVPVGVAGDLYIGGVCVGLGYLNNERATRQAFLPNPFAQLAGPTLYRTGDRCKYLPDGNIVFLGRNDAQVKIRGFRIELGDVESALRACPAVRDCAVVAHEAAGGGKRLVAYLTVMDGHRAAAREELKDALGKKLPPYMIPSAFAILDRLPLGPSGKVDRKALPAPDFGPVQDRDAYAAPVTPTEIVLAGIWSELLKLDRVGSDDNFFDLGGHSLLAVKLVGRIDRVLQRRLPIRTLFQNPTIRSLAALLEQGDVAGTDVAALVAIQTKGDRPPLFFLHGDWTGGGIYCGHLSRQLGEEQPFYAVAPYCPSEEHIATLQEMVDFHVAAIREHAPRGPYLLGGYCIGATVAVEIAKRLIAQGEEVRHLLLLDPPRRILPFAGQFWRMVDKWGDFSKWNLLTKIHCFERHHDRWIIWHERSGRWLERSCRWIGLPARDKLRSVSRRFRSRRAGADTGAQAGAAGAAGAAEGAEGQGGGGEALGFKPYCLASYLHVTEPVTVPATVYFPELTPSPRASLAKTAGQCSAVASIERVPGNHHTCVTTFAAALAGKMAKTVSGLSEVTAGP